MSSAQAKARFSALYIQVRGVQGVSVDEVAPGALLGPHGGWEDLVGPHRVLDAPLQQRPLFGIHRRLPELPRVHLAEALVALDGYPLLAGADHVVDEGRQALDGVELLPGSAAFRFHGAHPVGRLSEERHLVQEGPDLRKLRQLQYLPVDAGGLDLAVSPDAEA